MKINFIKNDKLNNFRIVITNDKLNKMSLKK